jgi:hypothetical protein
MTTPDPLHVAPPNPQQPLPPSAPLAPSPRSAGLAITALIIGIVAFVSGWVPVWGLIVGGAGVALGAIALAKKQSVGMAITGLILGGLAFLTSLVTTIIMIVGIGAAGSQTNVSEAPDSSASEQTDEAAPEEPESAAPVESEKGTRVNPVPLGSTTSTRDWAVTISAFNPDANALIADANMFNAAPEPGTHYVTVTYTATYTGTESAYALEVSVDLVADSGEVINAAFAVTPDPIGLDELYTGGTVTGSSAFLVPDGKTVTIRVTPGYFADEVFYIGG